MKSIKELALAKMSGFRHKIITVPEWGGVKVVLREPSGEGWLRWQEIAKSGTDEEEVTVSEKAHRNLCADVALFIDVLCDTTNNRYSIRRKESRCVKFMALFIPAC